MRFLLLLALNCCLLAETKVVLLGTGTPNADPRRSGPSTAVVVDGFSYVVDLGPGVVRRAAAAAEKGVKGLEAKNLKVAFLTHLHSDHTAGLADFYLTPAVLERNAPLTLIGPKGTKSMMRHIRAAYQLDIDNRIKGLEGDDPRSYETDVREIRAGLVYEDARVKVTAIPVKHGDWGESYGYRFDTKDRRVVISGDTVASEEIVKACDGCDVLVHEVYSQAGWEKRPPKWQKYHAASHTSGPDLGKLAARAKPKLLVLTHLLLWSATEAQLLDEVRKAYSGELRLGADLDVY